MSVSGKWYDFVFGTKIFAKRHNLENFKTDNLLYLIDYV